MITDICIDKDNANAYFPNDVAYGKKGEPEAVYFTNYMANVVMANNSWQKSNKLSHFSIWEIVNAITQTEIFTILEREKLAKYDKKIAGILYFTGLSNRAESHLKELGLK